MASEGKIWSISTRPMAPAPVGLSGVHRLQVGVMLVLRA
jgi:hypothetical protein